MILFKRISSHFPAYLSEEVCSWFHVLVSKFYYMVDENFYQFILGYCIGKSWKERASRIWSWGHEKYYILA